MFQITAFALCIIREILRYFAELGPTFDQRIAGKMLVYGQILLVFAMTC